MGHVRAYAEEAVRRLIQAEGFGARIEARATEVARWLSGHLVGTQSEIRSDIQSDNLRISA